MAVSAIMIDTFNDCAADHLFESDVQAGVDFFVGEYAYTDDFGNDTEFKGWEISIIQSELAYGSAPNTVVKETGLNVIGGTRTTEVAFSRNPRGAGVSLDTVRGEIVSNAGLRASNKITMTYDNDGNGFGGGEEDFSAVSTDAKISMAMSGLSEMYASTELKIFMVDHKGNTIENSMNLLPENYDVVLDQDGFPELFSLDFFINDFEQSMTVDGDFDFSKVFSFSWQYDGSSRSDDAFIDVIGLDFTPSNNLSPVVPAPLALMLLGSGFIALGVLRRRA
jgi:hypothetical protein